MTQLTRRAERLRTDERAVRASRTPAKAKGPALRRIERAKAQVRTQRESLAAVQASINRQLADLGDAAAAVDAEFRPPADGDPGLAPLTEAQQVDAGLSSMGLDDGLQDQRAERAGEEAARAEGITNPDLISARGQQAVLGRRRDELNQMAATVQQRMDAITARLGVLWTQWGKLFDLLARTPKTRAKLRELIRRDIAGVETEIEQLEAEREARRDQHASLVAQAAGIGFEIQALVERTATLPATAAEAAESGASSAALSAAEAAAANARREAGLSNAFIRAAFSPGDIGTGGLTAIGAAGGSVNYFAINTLLPSDPQTLQAIGRSVSASQHLAGAILTKTVRTNF